MIAKRRIKNTAFIYPIPIVIAGATVQGKPNFNTLGNVGIISLSNPPIVYISSGAGHYTNKGIHENGTFSVNFPSVDQVIETDYVGIVTGKRKDKSKVFTVFYGDLGNAPMVEECPVCLECSVYQTHRVGGYDVFYGLVEGTFVDDELVDEKNGRESLAGLDRIRPLFYSREQKYMSVGEVIGDGFSIGKTYEAFGQ